ncbi:hypothetical protein JYT16_02395 [Gemmatimonas aurantiaca]|nr:hypothetical protein [Gemmatimonas aurantiaca]
MRNFKYTLLAVIALLAFECFSANVSHAKESFIDRNDSLHIKLGSDTARWRSDIGKYVATIPFSVKLDSVDGEIVGGKIVFKFSINELEFIGYYNDTGNFPHTLIMADSVTTGSEMRLVFIWYNGRASAPYEFVDYFHFEFAALGPIGEQYNLLRFQTDHKNSVGIDERSMTPALENIHDGKVVVPVSPCCVLAGDADNDGSVGIGDATFLIARIFSGGSAPTCCGSADVNANGKIGISDVVVLIQRVFASGAEPLCGSVAVVCE